jgi:hypothetical protein
MAMPLSVMVRRRCATSNDGSGGGIGNRGSGGDSVGSRDDGDRGAETSDRRDPHSPADTTGRERETKIPTQSHVRAAETYRSRSSPGSTVPSDGTPTPVHRPGRSRGSNGDDDEKEPPLCMFCAKLESKQSRLAQRDVATAVGPSPMQLEWTQLRQLPVPSVGGGIDGSPQSLGFSQRSGTFLATSESISRGDSSGALALDPSSAHSLVK